MVLCNPLKVLFSIAKTTFVCVVVIAGCAGNFSETPDNVLLQTNPSLHTDGTFSGNWLAAHIAQRRGDHSISRQFFITALQQSAQSHSLDSTQQQKLFSASFLSFLSTGDYKQAEKLSDLITNPSMVVGLTTLMRGSRDIQLGQCARARTMLSGDLTDLGLVSYLGPIIRAWSHMCTGETGAKGDLNAALQELEALKQVSGAQDLVFLHTLLLNAHASLRHLPSTSKDTQATDNAPLPQAVRNVQATITRHRTEQPLHLTYRKAAILGEYLERTGDNAAAMDIYATARNSWPTFPPLPIGRTVGKDVPITPYMPPAKAVAEAMYEMAGYLYQQRTKDLVQPLAQLALYGNPQLIDALMLIGQTMEQQKKYTLANALYTSISATHDDYKTILSLRRAANFFAMKDTETALKIYRTLIKDNPRNPDLYQRIGDTLRSLELYEEAENAYNDAIVLSGNRVDENWRLLYVRGITRERQGKWNDAEKDFLRVLEMRPEQAVVLNYLGYSWIDQGINLEEGLKLIRKAVELDPKAGYIIDSLGWAYYRLKRYEEAVQKLEEAIFLVPQDPVINDHLGDAYWQVGRTREAYYQWNRALQMTPDAQLEQAIRDKITGGGI